MSFCIKIFTSATLRYFPFFFLIHPNHAQKKLCGYIPHTVLVDEHYFPVLLHRKNGIFETGKISLEYSYKQKPESVARKLMGIEIIQKT